jgi:phosphatidylserine/phosphatidylglycerophosphate/cardiolipin synthase-like enzyme
LLVDDELILSTWNISYTNFKSNKDIFLFIKDNEICKKVEEIFKRDFLWEEKIISHPNLLVSPYSSREKIEYMLKSAKKSLKLYIPYLADEALFFLLKENLKAWILITIITSDTEGENLKELKNFGANIIYSKRKIHAKAILKDDTLLFIWSINFSDTSMDENMELGILIQDKKIIDDFSLFFEKGL